MQPPHHDDLADVERVLAGDPSAFEGIVRRWQRPLVNLAYRFCRDRSRAEDLAQEAFLRAYRGLRQWRRQGMFSTWLFAVATNHYRSEIRRIPPAPLPLADFDAADGGDPPSDTDDDRRRAVRRAVDTLPPKYREALIVFYFQELDLAAAAAALGVPQGTLKARLSRARDLLRRKLPGAAAAPRLREAQ
jgi:RNA polymerase sigma-70 factor (ECF subfamily)